MSTTTSSSLSASTNPVSILTLLPTPPYLLTYSLPLLFLSLILTFAGAFLTLDRTRFFKQKDSYADVDMPGGMGGKFERWFKMEGGLGGIVGGWSFGFHLVTFLALTIPSMPNSKISKPLSPASFLTIYLLTSLVTAFLGGRFRYAALTMAGLTGGVTFALALGIIVHPTLLTRYVFLAITTPILLLFTLLPLVKFQHGALRFALSSNGAFGLVTSFALLSSLKAGEPATQAGVWWCHLFVADGLGWNTPTEKGLSAGYCLFLLVGSVTDWALRKKFGECPDEKWDSYLASFTTNGNLPDRAGTYKPFTSIWDRLSKPHATEKDPMIFPDETKGRSSPLPPYEFPISLKDGGGQLKKPRERRRQSTAGTRRNREAVKFRPLGDGDDSSDDDQDEAWQNNNRPWLRHASSTSSSTPTLVGEETLGSMAGFKMKKMYDLDPSKTGQLRKPPPIGFSSSPKPEYEIDYDKEIRELREKKVRGMGDGEVPEYSDHSDFEEDITAIKEKGREKRVSGSFEKYRKQSFASSSNASGSTVVEHPVRPPLSPAASMPVPATPSLIKALDRVAMAQKDAFGASGLPPLSEEEKKEGRGQKWGAFWQEVREKSSREDLK